MKTNAVVIEAYGGKDQLIEKEVTLPEIGAHQVLVKEKATSLIQLTGS